MPDSPPDSPSHSSCGTSRAVRLYRLLLLSAHLIYGCLCVGVLFAFLSRHRRSRVIGSWSRGALRILRVESVVSGLLPEDHLPTLVVSNHVSWLDITLIHSIMPAARFVAKADIRRWPVVGFLVSGAGTIFIERDKRHHTADANRTVVRALERGEPVAIFPEGTTTDGTFVSPFHASLFQPALGAGARVLVLALRYLTDADRKNADVHYAGDRTLWDSARLILAQPKLHAELVVAGTVQVHGKTRREIAREAELLTAKALGVAPPSKRPGTAGDPRGEAPTAAAPIDIPYPDRLHPAREQDPRLTSARR